MQHTIVSRQNLGNSHWQIVVDMRPATPAEAAAIARVERSEANEVEQELVTNYLLFEITELGNYSFVNLDHQQGRRFTCIVYKN
jgi:hypothetical protein